MLMMRLLIPLIETLVFIGRNLEPGDEGTVYFQDVESYREGVRYGSESENDWAKFETGSENELGHIFDYRQANYAVAAKRSCHELSIRRLKTWKLLWLRRQTMCGQQA